MDLTKIFTEINNLFITVPALGMILTFIAKKYFTFKKDKKNGGTQKEVIHQINKKVDKIYDKVLKNEKAIKELKKGD